MNGIKNTTYHSDHLENSKQFESLDAHPKTAALEELSGKRASDDRLIANIVTESARNKRIGLRDLSRKLMKEQGTALN